MRNIKYIVVHCTATPITTTIESILAYWREVKGWTRPGYHYIIQRSGEIVQLQDETIPTNGVAGYNKESIHLSYIGGVDKNNIPIDNRTDAQVHAMFDKIVELTERYPQAKVVGHRDFPGVTKACPSFDVRTWLRDYTPDLRAAA
jgi:N-acetylmuramoyl-L-alanine amidase